MANPEPRKASEAAKYKAAPETKKASQRKSYKLHSSSILFNCRSAYYASALCRCASKLVCNAVQSANKKDRVQQARYWLKEPKRDAI